MKHYDYRYFVREGIHGIFLHGFMSFAAVGIIVACLIIMGSFSLLSLNIDRLVSRLENENEMLAYVDESLTLAQAEALESKIRAVPNISDVRFVSSGEALEDYRKTLGKEGELLDGLDENPLRHRYRIFLKDISSMAETSAAVGKIPGIASVNARVDISKSFITVRRMIDLISVCLIAILIVVSLFIISNTIKLATFDRREEIAIMKMVGATNGFIRWPFVVEGFLLGVLGALFAFFLQWGVYVYVTENVLSGFHIIQMIDFKEFATPIAGVFLATGFAVGVGGSVLTIRRFLKV